MKVVFNLGCAAAVIFFSTAAQAQDAVSFTEPTYFVKAKQSSLLPGSALVVDVFLANATDVGAIQVQVVANDELDNNLTLTEISVNKASPTFVFGTDQIVEAKDMKEDRLALVKFRGGVTALASKPKYVGTFSFAVPDDLTGTITVGVTLGQQTMLLASSGMQQTYTVSSPITVNVGTDRVRPAKKGRRSR